MTWTSSPANKLKDICDRVKASIEGASSPAIMRSMGDEACVIIRRRTRLGYGVPDGGNGQNEKETLDPLLPSTIEKRKRYSDELSGDTSPRKSNLTATGQMLDSLATISATAGNATIAPTGTRRRSKLDSGRASNAQVAGYVAAAGRSFLSLSRLDAARLIRFFRNTFGDLLRNNRLK